MFGQTGRLKTPTIVWSDPTSQKLFMCLATDGLYDYHLVGAAASAMGAARKVTSPSGELDNITDWALSQFTAHYGPELIVTKDDIFAYTYAVLYDPSYRDAYALNLKEDNPRIPFYDEFPRWVAWGQRLLKLHIEYETVVPFKLKRIDTPNKAVRRTGQTPRVILTTDRTKGTITLDAETQLTGVPPTAWTFMLGNRCAIDWVLDQHREKASKDAVIREKFKPYRFADHKDEIVELLCRVVTVSVSTAAILDEMHATTDDTEENLASAAPPKAGVLKAKAKPKPKTAVKKGKA
jgi:predicted helicase